MTFESVLINYPLTRQVDCPVKTITNPILAFQKMSANDLGLLLDHTSKIIYGSKMGQLDDGPMNHGVTTVCSFDLITILQRITFN